MPKFIKEAPWYLSKDGKGKEEETILFHQRIEHDKREKIDNWFQKGYKKQKVVTKFRKGACENCGAISHKTKECLERPRKVGAKWTERDIARDEINTNQQNVKLNFESKRDRWNGYNPDTYQKQVIEEWNLKQQLEKEKTGKDGFSSDSDEDEGKNLSKGLRIREDTAKYLRNLDPNSAPYDPKSRSMKADPNPNKDSDYKGDNFIKVSGDYLQQIQNEGFMQDLNKRGVPANTLGMPSQFEMLQKEYKQKKEALITSKQKEIMEKYGGQESMPSELQEQLREQYDEQQMDILEQELEKQRQARALIDTSKAKAIAEGEALIVRRKGLTGAVRSKYEAIDAPPGGHSQVWGSYWHPTHKWGYKCCKSHQRDSQCQEYEPNQKRQKIDQ